MTIYSTMMDQYNSFIDKGGLFLSEHELSNGDYLLVNYQVTKYGLRFNFDQGDNLEWFDGDVKGRCGNYVIRWDSYFLDLDYYLQRVIQNIEEGYLIPNDLYV